MRIDSEELLQTYNKAIDRHGGTPKGVLWPNSHDLMTRFDVFSGYAGIHSNLQNSPSILDIGCGPGLYVDYLKAQGIDMSDNYLGIDISRKAIDIARLKHPSYIFSEGDIRDFRHGEHVSDVTMLCGVLTGRFSLAFGAMESMAKEILLSAWGATSSMLVFNVMSKHVDWEREDLFHWPLDSIVGFCKSHLSRHVSIRLDYGLYEASVCVRRFPIASNKILPSAWD